MDLSEFVKETLLQISAGVRDAQPMVRDLGGMVNPATLSRSEAGGSYFASIDDGHHVFLVDFDVAVTVAESAGANAEAKLKIASILSIGGGGNAGSTNASTNRISFKVPLALPIDAPSHQKLKQQIASAEADRQSSQNRQRGGSDSWMG